MVARLGTETAPDAGTREAQTLDEMTDTIVGLLEHGADAITEHDLRLNGFLPGEIEALFDLALPRARERFRARRAHE